MAAIVCILRHFRNGFKVLGVKIFASKENLNDISETQINKFKEKDLEIKFSIRLFNLQR